MPLLAIYCAVEYLQISIRFLTVQHQSIISAVRGYGVHVHVLYILAECRNLL